MSNLQARLWFWLDFSFGIALIVSGCFAKQMFGKNRVIERIFQKGWRLFPNENDRASFIEKSDRENVSIEIPCGEFPSSYIVYRIRLIAL